MPQIGRLSVVAAAMLAASVTASADVSYNLVCAPLHGVLGKDYFDYADPVSKPRLEIVEQYHFTPEVENLIRGATGLVPADLDFVLRALPNHYRALSAMGRWQIRNPKLPDSVEGRIDTAECYFKRAIAFRGDDSTLQMLYAVYLHQAGRLQDADQAYTRAEELGRGGAELFYNRGLLKLRLGDVAAAENYAQKAYALGYPLRGLQNRIERAKSGKKS